jgi:hypothetical protein
MSLQKDCLAVALFVAMISVGFASATCSNASLKGSYGALEFGGNGQSGVTLTHYVADGNGNLSGSLTTSVNGAISTNTFTGTYSISNNCTGSLTLTFPTGLTANKNLVIDDSGKGFQLIQTDSGWVNSGYALPQGTLVPCGLKGKKQTFAGNLGGSGRVPGGPTVPGAAVGQLTLSGTGTFSGKATFSINGTIYANTSFNGTYTVNADCTGTAQMTIAGFPVSNYNAVEVNGGKYYMLIETDNNTTATGTLSQ